LLADDLLGDFPFEDDASRAAALALLLTPVVRPAIAGHVPLLVVAAPKAGTGKGLLVNVATLIATGRPAAPIAAPARGEEWQKTIHAELVAGSTMLLFDEVTELRAPALAHALTADPVRGRILGKTETATVPQRATWTATGNNIRTGGDLARRCYWSRLDARTGRPWQRQDFRHPDLLAWTAQHRAELLAAVLTLARAWWAAGQPAPNVRALGSFEQWTNVVGGILENSGIPGFLDNLDDVYAATDDEAEGWENFLAAWHEQWGDDPLPVAEIVRALADTDGALHNALPAELAGALDRTAPNSASFKIKLGKALRAKEHTRYGPQDLHLHVAGRTTRGGQPLWRVLAGVQESHE
jgi:hypothetical protein